MNCPRCGKDTHGGYIHTCTPTEGWRKMETEIAELKRQLEYALPQNEQLRDEVKNWKARAEFSYGERDKLSRKLAESQARETRLREMLQRFADVHGYVGKSDVADALTLPHDDTALREYRDAVIEECANVCESLFDVEDDSCNEAELCAAAAIRKLKEGE